MDFTIPHTLSQEIDRFDDFLNRHVSPRVSHWYKDGAIPRSFFQAMGEESWFGFVIQDGRMVKESSLRAAMMMARLAAISPGVAVAALAHADLGLTGLWRFGAEPLWRAYGEAVITGKMLMCLGHTEPQAGSDAANMVTSAEKTEGGWILNGTKAYVTNGLLADLAVITAVTDPKASKSSRLSMFLVDLASKGIKRKKLNKQVWIPSDLTRIECADVFVPQDHLLGELGRGLQQVLTIFTYSRVPISGLTIGTAQGAYDMALDHAQKRQVFGKNLADFETKQAEMADFFARLEAARLMVWKACWAMDTGQDFRMAASLSKYLSVMIAREVTTWAADLFGAASVVFEHPIHKFPMDAWGSSLGEGTQDIQKIIIFRELMKQRDNKGVESGA
jgi:alkylation response protein AidB-like acyl-CoA dehydrogenase